MLRDLFSATRLYIEHMQNDSITITPRALIARLNRKLAHDGKRLCATRMNSRDACIWAAITFSIAQATWLSNSGIRYPRAALSYADLSTLIDRTAAVHDERDEPLTTVREFNFDVLAVSGVHEEFLFSGPESYDRLSYHNSHYTLG